MEEVGKMLSVHMEEGYAYRVDLRLRPYGRAGHLVDRPAGSIILYATVGQNPGSGLPFGAEIQAVAGLEQAVFEQCATLRSPLVTS